MRFNVTEKYYTDKNKTTVCILKIKNDYHFEWMGEFTRWVRRNSTKAGKKLPNKFAFQKEIKGFARLCPEDKFDYKIGRKIAREKAYAKLDAYAKKFEKHFKEELAIIQDEFTMEE